MKAKILIVGGGAMGTCIALHAATRCDPLREPVILIEKEKLGAGSSGRSPAIVHQGYRDRHMAAMARDALKVYSGLERSTGRSVGYRAVGVLTLADSANPAALERLEAEMAMQREVGIVVHRVEAEEIRSMVPGIEVTDATIGAYEPDGGFVDPVRTIESFATLARDRGAVTRIGVKNPTLLVEKGRAVGVETSAGVFEAPIVVLATGTWTPAIVKPFGIDLPLRVVSTQQHFMQMPSPIRAVDVDDGTEPGDPSSAEFETQFIPDPLDRLPVAHPVLIDIEHGLSARCEPAEQRTRLGRIGFDQFEDVADISAPIGDVSDEFRTWARGAIVRRFPAYGELDDVGSLAGRITLTPDNRPIVGAIPEIEGLFVATGFTGNDFQLAPSIGEGMAQMLLGEPVSAFDPEFFSLGRFQKA